MENINWTQGWFTLRWETLTLISICLYTNVLNQNRFHICCFEEEKKHHSKMLCLCIFVCVKSIKNILYILNQCKNIYAISALSNRILFNWFRRKEPLLFVCTLGSNSIYVHILFARRIHLFDDSTFKINVRVFLKTRQF